MKQLWTTLKMVLFLRQIENSGVGDVGILWNAEQKRWVVGVYRGEDVHWLTCNHIEPALRYFRRQIR